MTGVVAVLGGCIILQWVVLVIVVRHLLRLSTAVACEELHALSTDHKLEELTDDLSRRRVLTQQQRQRRASYR